MKAAAKTALTPLDLCVLIAHDAVSLLNTDAEAVDTALQLRTGLERYAAAEAGGDRTSTRLNSSHQF